jgi:dipeptidyl aminopeptidase/acylaminoacyl peptidase
VRCLATEYLLPGLYPVIWSPDGRKLYCRGSRGVSVQVLEVDAATGEARPLTNGLGVYDHLRISRDGKWLVGTHRTPSTLPEVWLLSTDGEERRQVTQASGRLEGLRLAEVEVVRWPSPGGPELQGILVKPLDGLPDRRPPTIVDLHGGPVSAFQSMGEFYPEWHWLAAQGYQIFAPEFRGSQLFGWDGPPTYNDHNFADLMSGVEHLIKVGCADPDRLVLRGHSGGAWLGVWVLGHTHRFRAAVLDGGGGYHRELQYGQQPLFSALVEDELGGKPWEVPEQYRRYSPVSYVHTATTPTLLLQGEKDNLPATDLLYTWLRQANVEVEYVQYREEGHLLVKPEHRADCWRRTLSWFDRHLAGGPDPAPAG